MGEIIYNDAEWRNRRGLLDEAGTKFESHMVEHYTGVALVDPQPPSALLSKTYKISPSANKPPSDYKWRAICNDVTVVARNITGEINKREKEELGSRLMLCFVSSGLAGATSSWQARESMRDMRTGKLPHGNKLNVIDVSFRFPTNPRVK